MRGEHDRVDCCPRTGRPGDVPHFGGGCYECDRSTVDHTDRGSAPTIAATGATAAASVTTRVRPERCAPTAPRRRTDPRPENLRALHLEYARSRSPQLEEELLRIYDRFAVTIAHRFGSRRDRFEDLAQVARIALLHAVRRFDPGFERPFTSFARVTIEGELKRHLRDRTWAMKVPRGLTDRYAEIVRANDELHQALGRAPKTAEIAKHLDYTEEQVLEGTELIYDQRVRSLDAPLPGRDGVSLDPAVDDSGFATIETQVLLASLLRRLPDREREILRLRFTEELSQSEIAARFGVSQMCISRTLARTLARLRVLAA